MNKYLLAVDVQPEFVKDKQGKKVYDKCINFLHSAGQSYTAIIACVYLNRDNPNMARYLNYEECKNIVPLEFTPDATLLHSGYSIKEYPYLQPYDTVDIIGFDTDACVLSACFDIFNKGCKMNIIVDGIWSSGGKKYHDAGLMVMKRQFGGAVNEAFKLW